MLKKPPSSTFFVISFIVAICSVIVWALFHGIPIDFWNRDSSFSHLWPSNEEKSYTQVKKRKLWGTSLPLSIFLSNQIEKSDKSTPGNNPGNNKEFNSKETPSAEAHFLPVIQKTLTQDEQLYNSSSSLSAYDYPWKSYSGPLSPLTKDYFRCRGSSLNPPIPIIQDGKVVNNHFDCGGPDSHSLPLRHEKEFIYPIMIELLNYLQKTLEKPVIITSGHRCPIHNKYVDSSIKNSVSKHLIGAEVDFYIPGLERQPELIISALEDFYKTDVRYSLERKEHVPFVRYEKESDVSTKPWMNKEIFIKYYLPHEGRNGDNKHPFSYFSLQVRFDRERQLKITVGYPEIDNYLRY